MWNLLGRAGRIEKIRKLESNYDKRSRHGKELFIVEVPLFTKIQKLRRQDAFYM
jgi:hypothetical protein